MEEHVLKKLGKGAEMLKLIGVGQLHEEEYEMGSRVVFKVEEHHYRLELRPPRQLARKLDAIIVEINISEAET